MPFDPVSLGSSLLLSATVGYAHGKYQRMAFMDDAVEKAAGRVAENHPGLEPEVFPAVFDSDGVKSLMEDFDAGGEPISPELVAEHIDEGMLDPDLEIGADELVSEFLQNLEQEVSQDPEIGLKLLMVYAQRISRYSTQLQEDQEELLFEIREVKGQVGQKGFSVFQTIEDRFQAQLDGEHPKERYDIPFYGRGEEIEEVLRFVPSEGEVLIISGPAGIGKTRLVVQASFLIEAFHPEWVVYTADIHAGNIDDGLDEIEWDEEENIILFIDDARDTDQVERLFSIADQHRGQVKLIFTERSIFTSSLADYANRFSLSWRELELPPLASEDVRLILRDFYGITDPGVLDWIKNVSEGKPLIAHLLADQLLAGGGAAQDPIASEDSIIDSLLDDTVRDIRRAAEEYGIGDPRKVKSYFRYLAAIGSLDTSNDELLDEFRQALSLDPVQETQYRDVLTGAAGTVTQRGDSLRVEPDVLREYVVYDTFFQDGSLDYLDSIYSKFGDFTEKEQVNNLLVIENRYDSTEAGSVVDDIVNGHIHRMAEYGIADRVRLLRRLEMLGAASPSRGIELVDVALTEDLPENGGETEALGRRILTAPSDLGNLYLAAISLISPALLREPEAATDMLLEIGLVENVEPAISEKVIQHLRQSLRPSFTSRPQDQQQVLDRITDCLEDSSVDREFRLELLDLLGQASSAQAEDFSMDPVNSTKLNIRTGPIPNNEGMKDYRIRAVDILIGFIEGSDDRTLKLKAIKQLLAFVNAQNRYLGERDEVFNGEELERIYEFAIEYVEEEDDLACLSEIHSLADQADDDLGVGNLVERLEAELAENEQYQLLLHMDPRGWEWEENEEKIRSFIRDLDPDWDKHFEAFRDVVEGNENASFKRFFGLFGEEQIEAAILLLDDPPAAMEPYLNNVLIGVCNAHPEEGKKLVSEYIENGDYDLACSGIGSLFRRDWEFAVDAVELILSKTESDRSDQLSVQLATTLRGEWEDHPEWTEQVFLELLNDLEQVTPPVIDGLLNALPHRKKELREVEEEVLLAVLKSSADFQILNQLHVVKLIIEVIAELKPERYVEFCIGRGQRSRGGVHLLPTHIDIDADRMRQHNGYDDAVQRVTDLIIDTDERVPQIYAQFYHTIPAEDVVDNLVDRLTDCSDDGLLRVIWYCKLFSLNEPIERILLAVMTEGVEDLRQEEAIQDNILSALSSSPMGVGAASVNYPFEKELEAVRDWQEDSDLPPAVRNFARTAEQYLLDRIEESERLEDELI